MATSFWPAMKACAAASGSMLTTVTSFTVEAVLLQEPGQREIGRGARRRSRNRLALHILDRLDGRCARPCRRRHRTCRAGTAAWWRRHWRSTTTQVSTVVAAHCTSPEAMARWRLACGIFLMVTSRPFLAKMPASFAKGQRRKAGPAGHADCDFGLRGCGTGQQGDPAAARIAFMFIETPPIGTAGCPALPLSHHAAGAGSIVQKTACWLRP